MPPQPGQTWSLEGRGNLALFMHKAQIYIQYIHKPRISLAVKNLKFPQKGPQNINLRNEKKDLISQYKRGIAGKEHPFHFIETLQDVNP